MAKGSEQPSWAWSPGLKECKGCNRTLTLKEVRVWESKVIDGKAIRSITCVQCYDRRTGRAA